MNNRNWMFAGCAVPWCSEKQENRKNRKLCIKKWRKIGKSIVLSWIKMVSLHPIRVVIKATSSELLRLQDLDQLSWLRRSDQYINFSLSAQLCCNQNDMLDLTGRACFYNQRWSYATSLQVILVGGKSLKSFEEWNFLQLCCCWRISN